MKGLRIGQKVSAKRVFNRNDLTAYQKLTGDAGLGYGRAREENIVPGPLLGGMFSDLLGTKLPGRGTNWLKQQYTFPFPAYAGDEITAVVEIVRLRPEKDLVNLSTICTNQNGDVVCDGEALVLVRDLEMEVVL